MSQTRTETVAPAARPTNEPVRQVAAAAFLGSVALHALGVFADGTPGEAPDVRDFLVICGVIAVATAVVFGWAVPRALSRPTTGTTAVVLSALALLLVPAFWVGIVPVLAAGGLLLGRAARTRPARRTAGVVAVVLGGLALFAVVAVYVLDTLSTNGLL